ncbi:MAG: hypothetical protein COT24_01145 [Candidatus Kerfeldbacteria bacterium CG08_land_8_20_14_0_20_40_16]|uniref:Glycosyl transferase family 1 domain-containing protein n=1 Tax=Candidatus Kerfeldbacteria bacterium CG08_land_8_20_14_0_20_40_16 TaxID=2014244 RepID=A0A2H0YWJ9_9BACT|nr:MAG: hypothetical protein COT24_01145 [Candidatus Kerfeldbacteria bacterium CG08_land_8_20_14_0_20_40_16]
MKIAIIIRSLRIFGGGERNVISLIEALNIKSIIPKVLTEEGVDEKEIEARYNKKVKFSLRKISTPKRRIFHFIREVFFSNPILPYLKECDFVYDFTNKPPLIFKSRKYLKYIYVLNDRRTAKFSRITRYYIIVTKILASFGIKKFQRLHPGIINITQSEYIQNEIKKSTSLTIPIIYPPVDLNKFYCSEKIKRSGLVSLGRFSPEKNHLLQIELAKKFPGVHFTFIGSIKNDVYFRKLQQKIKLDSLNNISLLPDATFKKVKRILCESLVFLHSTIEEHFGLSTVEAIAAGCLPLVHDSGGQREVVRFEEFRFKDLPEAVAKLENMLDMPDEKKEEYRRLLKTDIQKYDELNFQNKMLAYLDFRIQ